MCVCVCVCADKNPETKYFENYVKSPKQFKREFSKTVSTVSVCTNTRNSVRAYYSGNGLGDGCGAGQAQYFPSLWLFFS